MFDNLKKMYQLKKMQDEIQKETITVDRQGVLVTMNGGFEVTAVKLNAELSVADQEKALMGALNEARQSIQKVLAKKMISSGFTF